LNADVVVHGIANPLFAAQVAFRCLNGDMSKKELNLLQLSATCMAELGARAAEFVGSKLRNAELFCILLNDLPDHPFGYAVAPIFACAILVLSNNSDFHKRHIRL